MWNKIEDKLPHSKHLRLKDRSEFILILGKNYDIPFIGYYNFKDRKFYDVEGGFIKSHLTHWQELPPLPGKLSRFERVAERMANKFIFNQNVKRKWLTALGIPTNYGYPDKPKILGGYI